MEPAIADIAAQIMAESSNTGYTKQGIKPLFIASTKSKIAVIGQAPGVKAQASDIAWDDASGLALMRWLGVSAEQFRNPDLFALMPMDFYYPGKGTSGDLPPRPDFAPLWHAKLLALMPDIELTILIGQYAQKYYLGATRQKTLTETVRAYETYLPTYFPLVHPSPLNFRWFAKNPWFQMEIVPVLQQTVAAILKKNANP